METAQNEKRVLIVTSVEPERVAVLRGLRDDSRFTVRNGGVGPIAAAASTARILATEEPFDLVICAGISGGFVDQAEVGSLVVASEIVCADLGAETAEGFSSLDELGFGSASVPVDQELVAHVTDALQRAGLSARKGPVLTLSTVTGTAATALELSKRMPGAAAEAMEGYGVAVAAQDVGVPVLEIRAVSNAIGPRDKSAWRIKDALAALEAASSVLREVL
ncbi:futalosine hydrolase [Brevibacillus choshinensis]|uniref:futalosine hydrolase n=1 Tax=Brevibacillus choshinensis TaxID=54911 RepID=UPI002E1CD45E|nr:futalosine hydrolase [Brevibacillus choshinensis]MED4752684.1 futalosine hydrolase [Brevibacillus choshinensis]